MNDLVVPVALADRSYEVRIGADLLRRAESLVAPLAHGRLFVVTDSNIAQLHRSALIEGLGPTLQPRATFIEIPPGEEQKSFAGLEALCTSLIQAGAERRDLVVAFGGGVIGDLAGLAAGLVKRGLDFIQIPTTLLAQVDSSVGGKTAIDMPHGKNLIGLFNQPRLVLADLSVLGTLPKRELRAGYAEIVKYGLIDDPDFFGWCEANADRVIARETDALAHSVYVSVRSKARIVAADEREGGERALLNLGHTFAHALEASAGYDGALLHGEAVAAGLGLAFRLSARMGPCSQSPVDRVLAHLRAVGFETDLRRLPGGPYEAGRLVDIMTRDKKAEGGRLTLVLARDVGRAFVLRAAPSSEVSALLNEALTLAA
jgi:3-dehydroquinate synthase